MNDLQIEVIVRAMLQKFDKINAKQDIIIEQISALSRAYAKQNDLAIEEGEMECEYINDVE